MSFTNTKALADAGIDRKEAAGTKIVAGTRTAHRRVRERSECRPGRIKPVAGSGVNWRGEKIRPVGGVLLNVRLDRSHLSSVSIDIPHGREPRTVINADRKTGSPALNPGNLPAS